jgi:hypothetical protein|tara:strand:- start:96 stop:344 length:249 start_codon:yes stop_codon:yes gene_type:complete
MTLSSQPFRVRQRSIWSVIKGSTAIAAKMFIVYWLKNAKLALRTLVNTFSLRMEEVKQDKVIQEISHLTPPFSDYLPKLGWM